MQRSYLHVAWLAKERPSMTNEPNDGKVLVLRSALVLLVLLVVLSAPAAGPSELATVPLLLFSPPAGTATVFNKTEQGYIDYAWRSFIALNWPAKKPLGGQNRGRPAFGPIFGH